MTILQFALTASGFFSAGVVAMALFQLKKNGPSAYQVENNL